MDESLSPEAAPLPDGESFIPPMVRVEGPPAPSIPDPIPNHPSNPFQPIQRTLHTQSIPTRRHMQIDFRRGDVLVTQQILDRPQIRSRLEQMGSPAMA